jgi:hypothetical protein
MTITHTFTIRARREFALLAAVAISPVGLWLAAGPANADAAATCTSGFMSMTCAADVLPGLTCSRDAGAFSVSTTCNNTTRTDYTVHETTECAGGTQSSISYGPNGTPSTSYDSVDPSVNQDSIFVPANDTATVPTGSCDLHASSVTFSIETAPPPTR